MTKYTKSKTEREIEGGDGDLSRRHTGVSPLPARPYHQSVLFSATEISRTTPNRARRHQIFCPDRAGFPHGVFARLPVYRINSTHTHFTRFSDPFKFRLLQSISESE
ncbi:hypothetical protein BaRGS_00015099 [Batillaria attramentaria]|uniref:Uncharacterized protein n=1 Tax=Batillaria attramentaria TaxID=370345 RepID=A0ABD0L3H1_9CAEN